MSADEQRLYDVKPARSGEPLLQEYAGQELYRTTWKVRDNQAFWNASAQAWLRHRNDFKQLAELRVTATGAAEKALLGNELPPEAEEKQ